MLYGEYGGNQIVDPSQHWTTRHIMTLPEGICEKKQGNLKKPYFHAVRENKKKKLRYFETLEAAIASLDAYKKAKQALRIAKRDALSKKREKDLAVSGENCSLERRVSQALVRRHQELYNAMNSFVVNDFAKADVAFGYTGQAESDTRATFLATQVKTTPKPKNGQNGYEFKHVLGYENMPVVCVVSPNSEDTSTWFGYVFDGTTLHHRGIEDIIITPGGKNDELALLSHAPLDEIVTFLHTNRQRWPAMTEHAIRCDFKCSNHAKEYRAIYTYFERFLGEPITWPSGQGTRIDFISSADGTAQHKSARVLRNHAGFLVSLKHVCGTDENGNRLSDSYDAKDFETLVVTYEDPGTNLLHAWRIPMSELVKRGYVKTKDEVGKQNLWVHSTQVGQQPNQNAKAPVNTWTCIYYIGSREMSTSSSSESD